MTVRSVDHGAPANSSSKLLGPGRRVPKTTLVVLVVTSSLRVQKSLRLS